MINGVEEPADARRLVGRADTTFVPPVRVVDALWVAVAVW
jgi:hypothetical protein